MRMKKRVLAVFLIICLIAGFFPATAFAADKTISLTAIGENGGDIQHLIFADGDNKVKYSNMQFTEKQGEKMWKSGVLIRLSGETIGSCSSRNGALILGTGDQTDWQWKIDASNADPNYGMSITSGNTVTITVGEWTTSVLNEDGVIAGGVFTSDVQNIGTIDGGIFYGPVDNSGGVINGGTFYGPVENGIINGGTFYDDISGADVTFDISAGQTVTLEESCTANISNSSAVEQGGALINNGTVVNNAAIFANKGNFTNNGTFTNTDSKIFTNSGTFINTDGKAFVAPVIMGDRALVPVRSVTELLGGSVQWDAATRTVTLDINGKVLSMTIDKEIPDFGAAAVIMNDRTYVPIRYAAEHLGANVDWVANIQQVVIEK